MNEWVDGCTREGWRACLYTSFATLLFVFGEEWEDMQLETDLCYVIFTGGF